MILEKHTSSVFLCTYHSNFGLLIVADGLLIKYVLEKTVNFYIIFDLILSFQHLEINTK